MKHLLCSLLLALPFAAAHAQPPGRTLPAGVTPHRDLEYVEKGHARHRLDLYLPRAEKPLPLVVWIHGGAWAAGDKGSCPALFLTEKGYAVASINYRLSQHAPFPAQIEDCKAALRWLRANARKFGLDPERIGVWGASAGGHLVALLGTTGDVKELEGKGGNPGRSSRVQCVIDYFGPTDFTQMGGSHDRPNSPESRLLGGPVQENKEKAQKANPITYLTKNAAPFLIVHGDKDPVVPHRQSVLLKEALEKAGVPVELVSLPGAGHGGPAFMGPANRNRVEDFLERHLKK